MGRLPSASSLRTTLAELRSAARLLPELGKLLPGASWGPARLVERNATERPRAPALLHEDASFTWADVDARANQYARWFLGRGIGKRDVVALLMDNRPDFLFVQLGLAKLGAVAPPAPRSSSSWARSTPPPWRACRAAGSTVPTSPFSWSPAPPPLPSSA
jgi:non-ribosomal peptide synthetase component F